MNNLPESGLWAHFLRLCQVPRPSKKEHQAVQFMKAFAEANHLEYLTDAIGNVLIRKEATPGMEDRPGVILQAHLDMVPQKEMQVTHDFERDPIVPRLTDDGEWMKASGTTLGADDGIGVATAMEVLSNDSLFHGPVEALFTVDEETGLSGANALPSDWLKGRMLLNLDSEEEGEFCIGCAGGLDMEAIFRMRTEPVPASHAVWRMTLSGLKGGHSGTDILLGRANALKLANRCLHLATAACGIRIISWNGGEVRNAIPRHTEIRLAVPAAAQDDLQAIAAQCTRMFTDEFRGVEDHISLTLTPDKASPTDTVWSFSAQQRILAALYALPDGVRRMSADVPGLVETSSNWAIIRTGKNAVSIQSLLRSAKESAKGDLANMLRAVIELAGGQVTFSGGYPGWAPRPGTPLTELCDRTYRQLFNRAPVIKAIHAGLECGIIGSKYPGLDMISFGPTIQHPHTPDEALNLTSVDRFWQLLTGILRSI